MTDITHTVLWTYRPPWGPPRTTTPKTGSMALIQGPENTLSEREK